ncbi:MAG: toll/interleukin-1 receptor domain-containing protein [Alphaproteobacteria bacterium]|nr:toll/interleukin-1 receptor domain-containing protein [Alphaproteobacteria bacterium]
MSGYKYKAFISYSHADKVWAEWLLSALESYKVPSKLVGQKTEAGIVPRRLSPIFRDRDELPAAHRLTERLFEAIRASEYLIVLCSPRSAKSELVNREIMEFKRTHGDGHVLCMILDGIPFSNDSENECFPEALLHSFGADGRRAGLAAEGLAADVRPEGDGKTRALHKIVAGLIGVGLNDVVRREEQQRKRNVAAFLAASFAAMAVMGVLTYEATTAREEAKVARELAERQRDNAEMHLERSEEMMHYMMTVMYDRLLEHGNLDTLELVTQKILGTFQTDGLASSRPAQIFHVTGTSLRLGQNFDRKGDSAKAREIFEDTLAISRLFYQKHPNTREATFRLQNNLFFTGYLARRQGRLSEAEQDYRERLHILEQAFNRTQAWEASNNHTFWKDLVWEEKVADAQMALAALLGGPLGNIEEALPLHRNSISLLEKIIDDRSQMEVPDHFVRDLRVNLASALFYAGNTYLLAGKLDDAEQAFGKRLAIFDAMISENPDNYRVLRRHIMTMQSIAGAKLLRGRPEQAYALNLAALPGFDRLVEKDPGNTMWLGDSAKAYIDAAETAFATKDLAQAEAFLAKGTEQINEALARDDSRPKRRLTLYRAGLLAAKISYKKGDTAAATATITGTVTDLSNEQDGFLGMFGTYQCFAESNLFLSNLQALEGNIKGAETYRKAVIDTLSAAKASLDLASKSLLAQAFAQAGEREKAQLIRNELDSYGYRDLAQQATSNIESR